jgi:high-affinity nickel permease
LHQRSPATRRWDVRLRAGQRRDGTMRDRAARPLDIVRVLRRSSLLYGGLIAANVAAWTWAWMAFHDRPTLLGIALLAWVFGLRHAVDTDHIAASTMSSAS